MTEESEHSEARGTPRGKIVGGHPGVRLQDVRLQEAAV